jgi:hypothetical protein
MDFRTTPFDNYQLKNTLMCSIETLPKFQRGQIGLSFK